MQDTDSKGFTQKKQLDFKRVLLTNIEYDFLFCEGGDGLVAFLATLRAYKSNEVIKKVGKKGPVALIQDVTGLSRTTIGKYLPQLQEIGLLQIHENGNIAIRSRKWSDTNLPRLGRRKIIPIQVHEKFTDTKICVAYVRVHSRLRKQERQIGKKAKRIEVLEACSRNRRLSKSDYRLWKKLYRKGITLRGLQNKYRSTSTISNLSFHKILKDSVLASDCNINSGKNFKTKLMELGMIKQERQFKLKYPNVRDSKFLANEKDFLLYGGLFQGYKGIVLEGSPIITPIDMLTVGNKKKQVEK
ncbi:hypothetical protein [Flagellimonas okinawensis]|uniref:Helix-turn-helix domain-containing protein n=1 Tax=Flagellimonas okinawensis TaxID=3031324 RepID=A0ABT5XL45_9FLAO|nr:hypothetical protein [[Muricauda] okinawensis]MDF0706614.1 hypothetical protein [[Muricauda] okinawensis]